MISNCGHDENNNYHGGKAGDQTGGEWTIRSWYNRPWIGIFRHPNAEVRSMLADMARNAAQNNCVGYDMYQRLTFWSELVKANYKPENIKNACEADCSSGVAAMAKAVGYRINDKKLQNIPETMYTGNQKSILKKAGFEFLSDSKYLTSDDYLVPGDILYYNKGTSGHTTVNLDYGKKTAKPVTSTPAPTVTEPIVTKAPAKYTVEVSVLHLRIRKGPSTDYPMLYKKDANGHSIEDYIKPGKYVIVDTKTGKGSKDGWGKLEDGRGWIALEFAKKV